MVLGAVAWALAATSMGAVHAAEVRALGSGHTAEMPGEGELALVAHDARLAAMIVIVCGLAVVLAAFPRRAAVSWWSGGVLAVVIANATLGPVVDGGSVLVAAGALVLAVSAGGVTGQYVGDRHPGTRHHGEHEVDALGRRRLVGAGVLGAGTLPVLQVQGMSSPRYSQWVPGDLAMANLVTALALAAVVLAVGALLARTALDVVVGVVMPGTALGVLLQLSGSSWRVRDAAWVMGVVLALAYAPLLLASRAGRSSRGRGVGAGALVVLGGLLAAVPQLLMLPILIGGMLGLLVTMPAGAYVNYDGLPVIGGGVVIAGVLLIVQLVLDDRLVRSEVLVSGSVP